MNVKYELASSIVDLMLGIVLIIVCLGLAKKLIENSNDNDKVEDENSPVISWCFLLLLLSIFFFVGVIWIANGLGNAIECLVFPDRVALKELQYIYSEIQKFK